MLEPYNHGLTFNFTANPKSLDRPEDLLDSGEILVFLKTSCGWGFNKGFLGKRLLLLLSWSVVLLMAGSPVPGKEPSIEQVLLMCVCAQSCPTLCNPMDCSPLGSSVHGILQARVLEQVATSSSMGSS